MDFIDNIVSNRLGGKNFFNENKIFKFEKLKKIRDELKIKYPNIKIIDMGVGEPDKMADKSIVDTLSIEAAKEENRFYADNGIEEFKIAACSYLKDVYNIDNINTSNIVHGIGAKSILSMLPTCFINTGDITLMTVPGYPIIANNTRFVSGSVYELKLCKENNFYPEFELIPNHILQKSKLLYLNYPNNPTGQIATKEFYEQALEFAKKNNILIVSDVAYGPLVYNQEKPLSIFSVDKNMEYSIEIHSLSKAFNMTGWRLAFLVGSQKSIKVFSTVKSYCDSGQFRAIQKAGIYALTHKELIDINIKRYDRRFDLLVDALKEVGFKVEKPKGGFYCYVPIPKGTKDGINFKDAEEASHYILNKAFISTVPWDECGAFLRFSVTFEANSEQEEIKVINDVKQRLLNLNLVF
ncbi:LL-diaminopimelate aminotransferase [Romboutsia sp. 1001713B170207_170306_H8]|uniref:LL-diaminopimelate aminotransferase n=1 Tax=Romboutsia sp. 1001713B170207_170306_H8 TaxID=2787112 RepID=UPI00189856F9|nr:LL-diaminopimelate aminotransferase [Romboutsia sp. 1001713B170207_170306_H8]